MSICRNLFEQVEPTCARQHELTSSRAASIARMNSVAASKDGNKKDKPDKNKREKNERYAISLICTRIYNCGFNKGPVTFRDFLAHMASQGPNAAVVILENEPVTYTEGPKEQKVTVTVDCLRFAIIHPDKLLAAFSGRLTPEEIEAFRKFIPLAQVRVQTGICSWAVVLLVRGGYNSSNAAYECI